MNYILAACDEKATTISRAGEGGGGGVGGVGLGHT